MDSIIIAAIICFTVYAIVIIFVDKAYSILSQSIEAYKATHLPPPQEEDQTLRSELNEIKAKLSSIEISKGFQRNR